MQELELPFIVPLSSTSTLPLCLSSKPQYTEISPLSILAPTSFLIMWIGVISPIYFPSSSSACGLWTLAVFPICVRRRTQDEVLHLLLQIPQCWLLMTEAGFPPPPRASPKMHKDRQTDGQGRKSQRTVRGESSRGEQLSAYLGKVVGKSLLL